MDLGSGHTELNRPELAGALDGLHQGVIISDRKLAVVYINHSAETILGVAEGDELGVESLASWTILDESGESASLPIQDVVDEGRSWSGLLLQVVRKGRPIQWFDTEARPFRFTDGTIGAIFVFSDVTVEHRLLLHAEESERHFRAIAANANDVMWREDEQHRIDWVSESVSSFGYQQNELIGTEVMDLVHPDDQAKARDARATAVAGEPASAQVRVRRADGRWRHISIRANPFIDEGGMISGVFATARDVTSEAIAQEELRGSEERLRVIAATSEALSGDLDLSEICRRAVSTLAHSVGGSVIILLLNDGRTQLIPAAIDHQNPESRQALQSLVGTDSIPLESTLSEDAISKRMSVLISAQTASANDPDLSRRFRDYLSDAGVGSAVLSPLFADDTAIGVLVVGRQIGCEALTDADRLFIDDLGWRIALAIDAARLRERLRSARRKYRLIAESASDVVVRLSLDARHEWVSPSVQATLGWTPAELMELTWDDIAHPDDLEKSRRKIHSLQPGTAVHSRFRFRCKDGSYKWMEATLRLAVDEAGQPDGVVAGLRDIDAEVAAQTALKTSEQMFRLAMEHAPIGKAIVGLDGKFIEVNEALCTIVDYSEAELVGKTFQDITHPDDLEMDLALAEKLASGEINTYALEKRYIRQDGREVWVELHGSVVRAENGNPLFYIAQVADIDELRRARANLEFRAEHDVLTGALNRRALLEAVSQIASGTDSSRAAMLYCDIDVFKSVNDSYGHDVGDEVLRRVVARLSERIRGGDLISRVGGDEFVIAVTDVDSTEQVRKIAESMRDRACADMTINGVEHQLTMCIGVARFMPGENPRDVIRRADGALYQAKRQGRGRVVLAAPPADPVL